MTTSLKRSIAVSPPLLLAWGYGAATADVRYPKSDSLLAGAGKTTLPLAAPPLASLVPNRCFLNACVIRTLTIQIGHSSIGQKAVFFSNFYSITKTILEGRSSLRRDISCGGENNSGPQIGTIKKKTNTVQPPFGLFWVGLESGSGLGYGRFKRCVLKLKTRPKERRDVKIHSLRLVKPRKGAPGDRLGSI